MTYQRAKPLTIDEAIEQLQTIRKEHGNIKFAVVSYDGAIVEYNRRLEVATPHMGKGKFVIFTQPSDEDLMIESDGIHYTELFDHYPRLELVRNSMVLSRKRYIK